MRLTSVAGEVPTLSGLGSSGLGTERTHQGKEGQKGPDSRPGFQRGCSGFTHSVEPTVSIIDPI